MGLHLGYQFYWCWWFSCQVVFNSCDPMDCSPPGFSVHGILQERILQWIAISFSRESSHPGIEPGSPALQADSLPPEPPGKLVEKHNHTGKILFPLRSSNAKEKPTDIVYIQYGCISMKKVEGLQIQFKRNRSLLCI